MRNEIRFLRGGREVRLSSFSPTLTLLDYLRLQERALGTKEGCAEGDCGACTVVLRRCVDGHVTYAPVNSCILFAGQADGAEVIAVDDLANGGLHPVQQAMVETHGSQCGFCTPGFIMALFGLYHAPRHGPLTRAEVNDFIAGNLCRCTGYRPIVDAALAACAAPPQDRFADNEPEVARRLAALADDADVLVGDDQRFFAAPASIASLADIYAKHPDAVLVSGATDVGLWVTKQLRDVPKIIWLGRVRGLDAISDEADAVTFGATATHQAAMPHLAAIDPDLGALLRRFAGRQVRTVGTLGGNIANGSPIGDTPPALIALGSTLDAAAGRHDPHRAARGFLHRLRASGSPARRVRAGRACAQARPGRLLPLLQNLEALRFQIFPPSWARSASPAAATTFRQRALPSAAWRQRRAAQLVPRRRWPVPDCLIRPHGRQPSRRLMPISHRSLISAAAPAIAATRRARFCAKR